MLRTCIILQLPAHASLYINRARAPSIARPRERSRASLRNKKRDYNIAIRRESMFFAIFAQSGNCKETFTMEIKIIDEKRRKTVAVRMCGKCFLYGQKFESDVSLFRVAQNIVNV